jgi:serine/threonine-protein kinase
MSEPTDPLRHLEQRDLIAEGGTGGVYVCWDGRLERRVAKKILHDDLADDDFERERFVREARLTATLSHPYVIPVHDLAAANERPAFSMKCVEGQTLWDRLPSSRDELTRPVLGELLDVFLKVCDAVAYAHSLGVVHCDIKPDNIVVGDYGQVYLMDWGAAITAEDVREDGLIAGTPSYMAPEQASGDVARIDARTDVFGLGALLYEIITLQPPYDAELKTTQLLAKARSGEVSPPEEISPRVPAALARIAMRALSEDPAGRYESVAQLAKDIRQFLTSAWGFPTRLVAEGELIIREGEAGDAAYIVASGSVEVFKNDDGADAKPLCLGPGEVFGETALLTGEPRNANVRAASDAKVVVIAASELRESLARDSWFGGLVFTLARRFRDLDERAAELRRERDDARLVRDAVVRIAQSAGEAELGATVASLAARHQVDENRVRAAIERAEELFIDDGADRLRFSVLA